MGVFGRSPQPHTRGEKLFCFGIVIGFNGTAVTVQWMDKHTRPALGSRTRGTEKSVEMPEFLEVISGNR